MSPHLSSSCRGPLQRIVLAALAVLPCMLAHGGTTSSTFQASATVISACTVTGTNLSFGTALDPLSSPVPVDASATLSVVCTNTTPYAVALSAGANAGGPSTFGARAMKSGSQLLPYQLYTDAARSVVWGDGTSGSSTQSGVGTGSNQSITVYGRLPSLSGVVPGTYTDTVTVTITY
ncbi:spore coat U domain-containing protein [Aquabacterium sp. J223]|uniref:Csu type fimbrial protein n=1 Tax=Aquabacterium sp. J223 TaxID=2898431 RepID=UPI0021ADC6D9|nr:spore coat U domain-containing protein [Aquabacterium sp. J223]UUX97691.1 spore coat U domain-containing protein [Aquabacterium sp. J223]